MNDTKTPRLRFPKYADDWEQRKLDDILIERHVLSKISEKYPRLSFTIEEGVINPEDRKTNKRDFLMKDEANKKFLITEVGDIIYNPANVVFGAIHRNSYGRGCLSPIYRIFDTNQESRFLECVVRSETFISKLAQKTEGSVVKLKTLKPEAFLGMNVYVSPDRSEQEKIADFFGRIDTLIDLHQQKVDEIKKYKMGMFQKMFPKEGENVPDIRFSGFTDKWEQRKLSELISEYKETVDSDCDLPVLTSSKAEGVLLQEEHFGRKQRHDITGYNVLPRNYCTYRNRSDGVDFTFNINRCCDKGIISKFYPVFCGKNNDTFFISLVLNHCDEVVREIGYTCIGTGQKVLSFSDLQKMYIKVPVYEEQKKIATCFEQLDTLISLHQRKLDAMKEYKKGLLQQMFV